MREEGDILIETVRDPAAVLGDICYMSILHGGDLRHGTKTSTIRQSV
jgi:hypothetical protein